MSQVTETVSNSSNIVDQFLNKSLEYLNSAEAFLKAEVPAFIQELIQWEFYNALGWGLIQFGMLSITIFVIYKIIKSKDYIEFTILPIAFSIIVFTLMVFNINTIIKIKVAPRVFLLEEVRQLVK